MWKVIQYVFTLPHGQSHVERGFNINDDIMVVNMKAESLVAQRLVYVCKQNRRQILNLNTYIENLEKQSTECFRNAGAEKDLVAMRQLVEEGNDAREMYEKKKKTKLELENAIQKLQLELAA